jgi:hypothetical protein
MPWRDVCGANGKTEGTSRRMSVTVGGMRSRLMDGRRQWSATFARREQALGIMSCRS